MKTLQLNSIRKLFLAVILGMVSPGIGVTQSYDIHQTLSDGAQRHTIAFDGLAFLTGDFCSCSFVPPGKVADFFGFQYLRDNDPTHMGHNTDFSGTIGNDLLHILNASQKQKIINLAKAQVPLILQYAYDRFPLIDAFIRTRDQQMPAGATALDREAVETYSAQLYRLDGRISLQRAQLYAEIINSLSPAQKHYLDSIKGLGMGNMPVYPLQIDKSHLNNNEFVAVMTFADDIFSWYAGNVESDVYFCPERQGDYFGGFFIKDAPAMGNQGYAIDTALTQEGGQKFLDALTPSQKALITGLVDTQRTALLALVDRRTDIAVQLRNYLAIANVDTAMVLNLSEAYGRLDGEISFYYAMNFSKVNWTLSSAQKDSLHVLRNLSDYPCTGAYLYSDTIPMPDIRNTDFLFGITTAIHVAEDAPLYPIQVYPNPARNELHVVLPDGFESVPVQWLDLTGQVFLRTTSGAMDVTHIPSGMYILQIGHGALRSNIRVIIQH